MRGGGGGGVDAARAPARRDAHAAELGSGGGDDAAVADDDVTRGVAAGAAGLDRLDDVVPFEDLPEAVCLPFRNGVATVHRKNCEPLVLGPALAMDRMPGPWWGSVKFSSANVRP